MLPDWEIWLDQNIAPIVGKWLKDDFDLRVKSAYSLQMQTLSDFQIYQKAKEAGRIIILSRDSDIKDIINTNGAPPKLINRVYVSLFFIIENQQLIQRIFYL